MTTQVELVGWVRLRSFGRPSDGAQDGSAFILVLSRVGAVEPVGADFDGGFVGESDRGRSKPRPYKGVRGDFGRVDGGEDGVDFSAVGGKGADGVGGGGVTGE
jgi:hypothetical protein